MRTACRRLLLALMLATGVAAADEFDHYHPDQKYRRLGAQAWERDRHADAVRYFERAARYADKPSQLALAFAHWQGDGVAANRPLAYVWADVAAERGYPDFVGVRERFWAELTPSEQAEATALGPAIAAEYGDRVAKRRLEGKLRQGYSRKTGSRTGSGVSAVGTSAIDASARALMTAAMASALNNIHPGNPALEARNKMQLLANIMTAVGARHSTAYYADMNWKPADYWRAQDAQWSELDGVVEIGPLQSGD